MSDSGTRTKTKQTREQWLDAHEVQDPVLRGETLKNFKTRDDIQAYVTKMQRPRFSSGDPFEVDDLLSLPRVLGLSPDNLMAWRKAIGEGPLIDIFIESWSGGTIHASQLKADLHTCIALGMPPEYLKDSPGHNFYWSRSNIISAWKANISIEDLGAYLRALSFHRLNKSGITRDDVKESGSIETVLALHSTGVPATYFDALHESVTVAESGMLFRAGADATTVVARMEANPKLSVTEMLAEIEEATPQLWNVMS